MERSVLTTSDRTMRALILVALLALGHTSAKGVNTRAFEDIILATIECVREELTIGLPDFGLPGFDPLKIVDYTFVFDDFGLPDTTGQLNVQDLTFSGLMDFTVSDLSGTIGLIPPSYTIKVTLTFPQPALSTKYVNDLTSGDISTWGEGTLDFVANNFRAAVDLKATILGGIGVEYFNIWVSMDPLSEFVITGVRNDEEYSKQVSEEILTNGVQIIADLADEINAIAGQVVDNLINEGDGGAEGGFLDYLITKCL